MSLLVGKSREAERWLVFHPVEWLLFALSCSLGTVDLLLAWQKGIAVQAEFFYAPGILAIVFVAIGQFYRRWRDSERIALVTHAIALVVLFSTFCALFNVLLLPRSMAPIDALLVEVDSWFGYSWPELTGWIANYPTLNAILRAVYLVTLAKLYFALMFLAMVLDRRRLHAAALAMSMAAVIVVCIWAMFPSAGASAYWLLDPEVDRIVRPVVGSEYGAMLYRLYAEGVSEVNSLQVTGLVGFPSFHTVLGLMTLIAVWPYRLVRYVVVVLNLFLAPAILIHGGHNLVDMIAGVVITLIAWRVALAIFEYLERTRRADFSVVR